MRASLFTLRRLYYRSITFSPLQVNVARTIAILPNGCRGVWRVVPFLLNAAIPKKAYTLHCSFRIFVTAFISKLLQEPPKPVIIIKSWLLSLSNLSGLWYIESNCLIVIHFVNYCWHWCCICFLITAFFPSSIQWGISPICSVVKCLVFSMVDVSLTNIGLFRHIIAIEFQVSKNHLFFSLSPVSVSVKLSLSMMWFTYSKIEYIC